MKDLREFKIKVPGVADYFAKVGLGVYEEWKAQCERVNALFDRAEEVTREIIVSNGVSQKRIDRRGFFIPMPEEPDSVEKLIEDLAEYANRVPSLSKMDDFAMRARALMAKGEK